MSREILATMITTTTYGTWLPGDTRGYVEDGIILPSNPPMEDYAKKILKSDPVYFSATEQEIVLDTLVHTCEQYNYQLFCVSIESWHLHLLIDARIDPTSVMVGRLKNAMRKVLKRGRVWTKGYDKRFCFSQDDIDNRYSYIARHDGFREITPIRID